jgi:predicted RNase H-related nuclease YkuK (DUF458 family)
MKSEINFVDILAYLEKCDSRTKIYVGCDSERILSQGKFYADYTSVVVVHVNGNNGCKIFSETVRELDYDNQKKPYTRLMNEVYKVADLYQKTLLAIGDLNIEVHLDINSSDQHFSNNVVSQAIGYIRGVCNVEPMIKPMAWAATCAADRAKSIA